MPTFYNQGVGGNYPERMKLQTIATLNSQDITNNKSNITITCYGYYDYPEYNVVNPTDGAYYLKIDDVTKKSGTQNLSFVGTSPTKKVLIFRWTGDVAHAADGSKTINIKAYQDCPGVTTLDYLYGSNNWKLPTIPRASTPTLSSSTAPLESAVTISTNRASDTFKHTLKYAIGAQTGTIATNVDTSHPWSPPETIANAIPNAKSGVVTITCETYSGTTLVGSKTVSLTVTVPKTSTYLPTVPLPTITEGATGLTAFTAKIQGKSKFRVRSTATPKLSATISQYKVVIDGSAYYGPDITSAIIGKSGTIPVELTVTDSRGYAVKVTVNVTVEPYSPPKIINFTAGRAPTDQGVDLSAPVNFSISPIANQNTKRYILRYRPVGGAWTDLVDSTAVYASNLTATAAGILDGNLSYEVELLVSDYFGNASKVELVRSAFELLNFNASGRGVAFGKVSELDALEVAMPLWYYGKEAHLITESGSSSSGRWVKFSDGTMICFGAINATIPEQQLLGGFVWGTTGTQAEADPVTFPQPFVGAAPTLSLAMEVGEELNTAIRTVSTTAFTWRLYTYSQVATGSTKKLMYTAIGRWKA